MKIQRSFLEEYDASKPGNILSFLKRNFFQIIVYRHALVNFISTNLSSRYRRSTFGFLWSLLNPLFTMVIMALVFSSLFKQTFAEFGMYLFSGILPWNLISSSLVGGTMSIVGNEGYLKKVYIPKLLFLLVALGVELTNFLFSLMSLMLLALLFGAKIGTSFLMIPIVLFLTAMFLLGLVMTLSVVNVFFRDLSHILQIILLGVFYLTPILYPISLISESVQNIIKFNPFYYFILLFQTLIFEGKVPNFQYWLTPIILTAISLFIGVFIFHKKENDVIYRL